MIRWDDLRDLGVLLGRFARPYLGSLGLSAVVGLAVAALTTLQPVALAPLVDVAAGGRVLAAASWREVTLNNVGPTLSTWLGLGQSTDRVLVAVALAYVALVTATAATSFANILLISWVRTHLFRDMQAAIYRHVLGLSMSYFARGRPGTLSTRLTNDVYQAAQTVDPVVRGMAQGLAQLAIVAALLARTDAWLALGVLAVLVGRLVVTRLLRDRVRALVVDEFDLSAELASRVQETMLGIRIVKSFGAERFELARFAERARHLARVTLKGGVYKFVEMPLGDVADAIGLAVVLLMAFAALAAGRLSVAGLVLFMVLVRQALQPIALVSRSVLLLQTLVGAARPLLDVLRETPAVADGSREAGALRRAIELEDVDFTYELGPPVLEGISLEVRRGEVLALVGPSGSGKSTLADLIVRLCDPTHGRVTWDGVDIRLFRQESYRRRVGVVSQEALLFNATVAENIAYGRPVDGAAVARAARVAHADGFIGALPRGLDTPVGERGVQLSGGQRQRIAIARAVYGAPDVLVLDEATSALDSESEAAVQAAIDEVSRGVTVIVIAHRLSTVIHADRIVVLEAGRITATGTHDELLDKSPLYRRLCAAQFLDLSPRASAPASPIP